MKWFIDKIKDIVKEPIFFVYESNKELFFEWHYQNDSMSS